MEIRQIGKYEEIKDEIICLRDTFVSLFERVNVKEYAEKLSRYASVYVLKDGTKTCGLAAVYMNDKETRTAYITLIGVAKEYQRRNLGTLLIRHCMEQAKSLGMKTLRLEVDKENHGAIAFYEKEGLQIMGESSEQGFYMVKLMQ